MRIACFILSLSLISFCAGCGQEKNKALSLQFFDTVYAQVSPETFLSLDKALKEYGYGNVTAKNTKTYYVYSDLSVNGKQSPYMVIYTDINFIPSGSSFQPMRVYQCYEILLADTSAAGILVNPDVEGRKSYSFSREEIASALPRIPKKEPLAWQISIKQ